MKIAEGWTRKGSPDEVREPLRRSVAAMVRSDGVSGFYIGRSNSVEARTPKHGGDEARCLYESSSPDRAMDVEDDLIKFFHGHPKCLNDAEHSGGNVGPGLQHVYIVLWRDT